MAALLAAACGDRRGQDDRDRIAATRARQARQLAAQAGLSSEVGAVLAAAASSVRATYAATYEAGETRLRVYADPPRRRVDTYAAGQPDRRTITTADHTYVCTRATARWTCQVGPPGETPGAFRPDAIAQTVGALTAPGTPPVRATTRRIVGLRARCIEAGDAVVCVSPAGVPLLVAGVGGDDVRATSYRDRPPAGVFDRPDGRSS